jgi:hypothetical protein
MGKRESQETRFPVETRDVAQCFIPVSMGWGRLLAGARKSAASVSDRDHALPPGEIRREFLSDAWNADATLKFGGQRQDPKRH